MAAGRQVYAYEFDDPNAPNVNGIDASLINPRASHASDLPYLFDLDGSSLLTTDEQRTLADRMVDYWTSFARTGVPAAAGAPAWPRMTAASGPVLQLAPTIRRTDFGAEHRCGFWSALSG